MYQLLRSVFVTVAAAGILSAAPVTFAGSSGNLAASATFDTDASGQLMIRLTNTATAMSVNPAMLLTAVYFDYWGSNPTLSPVSAMMGAGATVACSPYPACAGTLPVGGNVSGEWAYETKADEHHMPREFGASSSGLGLFGSSDRFGTVNLFGPADPDGMQYGIATANYNPLMANGGLQSQPVVVNSVTLTLSGFTGKDLDKIRNVLFQYGTDLCEPQVPGDPWTPPPPSQVPEPATMAAMGSGLTALALLRRRRK